MYYVVVVLVLSIECEFVHFHRKLTGDIIQFVIIQLSIPHLVKCALHERIAGSAAFDHDLLQVRPLDFAHLVFNLHAYSIVARSPAVNIFCTLFFTFFWAWTWTFAHRIESKSRKIVRKNVIFFCEKCLTVWVGAWYNRATPPLGGRGGRESSKIYANPPINPQYTSSTYW